MTQVLQVLYLVRLKEIIAKIAMRLQLVGKAKPHHYTQVLAYSVRRPTETRVLLEVVTEGTIGMARGMMIKVMGTKEIRNEVVKITMVKMIGTEEVRNDHESPQIQIKANPTTRSSRVRIENMILEDTVYSIGIRVH
jgi:hypothetical protein